MALILIPCRILKKSSHRDCSISIQFLFAQSLESGIVQSDWLKANITPVFKKGSKHLAANYRPISLTAVPCKISTVEEIAKAIDNGKQTDLIIMEFSKAFDIVPHQRLNNN